MAKYGLPYKGSKNKLADWIVNILPEGDTLVDLFAGGCAITDCAMRTDKWKHFIINDIDADIMQLFVDAINGKYKNDDRWISREDFERLKDSEPYVRYCWSFCSNGRDYLYGKDVEPYKKALHHLIYGASVKERRLAYKVVLRELNNYLIAKGQHLGDKGSLASGHTSLESLENLERLENIEKSQKLDKLERLQSLENLERLENIEKSQKLDKLERLQSLENLERFSLDYQSVPIPDNAVIYCDIPYKGTNVYGKTKTDSFDYERFYDWAAQQKNIYISEYSMPEDRFEIVAEKEHLSTMSATNNNCRSIERIYTVRR